MKIVIATGNVGKFEEFSRLLSPLGFLVVSKNDEHLTEEVEETGNSFIENAIIKAKFAYERLKLPVLADDSGLVVEALNGEPGIFSARYATNGKEKSTDEQNNNKLLKKLEGITNRKAKYVCALSFINSSGKLFTIEETCEGEIAKKAEGTNGFGYDPIFVLNGKSFGNLKSSEKDLVSHRGKAFSKLKENILNWF